jgi:hypothetical protein
MGILSEVTVRQPVKGDLVGRRFVVSGVGNGFEGTIGIRVMVGSRTIATGSAQSSGGNAAIGEFSTTVTVAKPPRAGTKVRVQVYGDTGDEGPGSDLKEVEVVMYPDLSGWLLYRVERGDTLTGLVRAASPYGRTTVAQIVAANPQVSDPDVIKVGWKLRIPLS